MPKTTAPGEIATMEFELTILIYRPIEVVFAFFRDKDLHPQKPGSPVLALEKTTPGPVRVGTCYREVVQMLPFYRGEILSEITRFVPETSIEEKFHSLGMSGNLVYRFLEEDGGTRLIQQQRFHFSRVLGVFKILIKHFLGRNLEQRLEGIKKLLEES